MAEAVMRRVMRREISHRTLRSMPGGWEAAALFAFSLIALGIGLVAVYSASSFKAQAESLPDYYYVVRQAAVGAIGLALLAVTATVDYRRLRLLAVPMLVATVLLLIVLVVPGTEAIAPRINNARRWLVLGPIMAQPSEMAKAVLIVWTAARAVDKQDRMHSFTRGLLPFVLVWGLVAGLIAIEPSFSAAALTLVLAALVLFVAGARLWHIGLLAAMGIPVLWLQLGNVAYQAERLRAFLAAWLDPATVPYQLKQALIAIGSGGPLGRGIGHGLQKFGFLPEPHNDFLLAMIGEEWGLVGVFGVVILFVMFAGLGYRIARQARDRFGFLLAVGLTNLIVVQALLHMGVNLALLPTTGVTLPLMSYGRSSLIVCLAAIGVLMNIAGQSGRRME
ncbi:MAG: putative lipid II flippase FtsW [Gemmatimonadetes bacterium]|nr:putative lipid II flippase FtsW [Gemmatimonadota bacterium]